jgi:serine protease Do
MTRRRLRTTFWLGLSLLVPLGVALFLLLGRGVIAPLPGPLVHAVPPAPTPTTAASTSSTTNVLGPLEETIEHIYTQVTPSVVNIRVVQRQEAPLLIKTGHYTHPWLGVSGISLTPDLAKAMELKPEQRGGLVMDVIHGSPADKAGLHGSDRQVTIEGGQVRVGGDVIIAMNKQPVTGFDDLVTALSRSTAVDQTISLTVLRHGKEEVVQVTLAARPQTEPSRAQAESPAAEGAWLGIRGLTLTPQVAKAMRLPADQQGVLVERVERGSPADRAGLRGSDKGVLIDRSRLRVGGDVIVACDEQPVTRMAEFQTLLQLAHPGQKLLLTLLRNGKPIRVAVSLAETPAARS